MSMVARSRSRCWRLAAAIATIELMASAQVGSSQDEPDEEEEWEVPESTESGEDGAELRRSSVMAVPSVSCCSSGWMARMSSSLYAIDALKKKIMLKIIEEKRNYF